ncbi:MAG: Uma2 family endonuclease [Hydrococcus sp. RM1_1_31]|nr:Uma2 family endonuclease [Hydrococcus sp. RM1_1_31]
MALANAKRFSVDEYHHLIDLGFFHEDERIELIRGEIVQRIAKGTAHTVCSNNLVEILVLLLTGQATIRVQDPILLPSNSELEPDLVIARKRKDNYLSGHPTPEDILLVIEVADSSLNYDRDVKIPLYAEAKIQDYWIFNLQDNQLETYSNSYQKPQGDFDYQQKIILLPDRAVNLPQFPNLSLNLSQVFPDRFVD